MPTIDGAQIGTNVKVRVVENGFIIECGFTSWVAANLKTALRLAREALEAREEAD